MTLEDPRTLKKKNKKRLRDVKYLAFALGINVTSPWPFKDNLWIISALLAAVTFFNIFGHVAFIIRHKDSIIEMAESLCTLLQVIIAVVKLIYMIFMQEQFYEVLRKIQTHELIDQIDLLANETPYNKELRREAVEILDHNWRIAMRQLTFYMASCCTLVCYYFFGAIGINTYNSIIGNTNHTNILSLPTLFPFWEDKMNQYPYYPILTILVGGGHYVGGIGALSFDGTFIFMAMHGVALLRILRKSIIFTTSPKVPRELRVDYLHQCILHYERTYQYYVDVNSLYLHISFIQFLMSLVILGIVMFQGALELESDISNFVKMLLFMSAAGFEVLVYCLNGQFITNESETIPYAWYECEWYNESVVFKQLIWMMIMRTNRVMIMKASRFTTMSLQTFLEILKKSYSYFLLLSSLAF